MTTTDLYSLVENPGMESERVVRDGLTYKEAMRAIARNYTSDELARGFVQIMREGPEGLTTEY